MTDDRVQDDAPKPETTPRGRRLLRAGLVIVTIVVLVDAVMGEKGLLALMRARDTEAAVAHDLQTARQENLRMVEQARRYREDAATIEVPPALQAASISVRRAGSIIDGL